MATMQAITVDTVRAVYSGPEWHLWELIMGEQVHLGGLGSSQALADAAEIKPGTSGVDLCCCTGAGMRFLVRFRQVARMCGVDATAAVVECGRQRCRDEGLADRIQFVQADVTDCPLPDASADFIWGEDAWCYVVDKPLLISEAARLVRPGGRIAFTDWLTGPTPMTDAELRRFQTFMKFPNVASLDQYRQLLERAHCRVLSAKDTGRFAPAVDLYLNMLGQQLTYDALKIIGFDQKLFGELAGEMTFVQQLAHAGKVVQGQVVAQKQG
jgi:SAM-dependent methyltransferase